MIWLFGGTSDANRIAEVLAGGYPLVVSTATEYGEKLAQLKGATVIKGRLSAKEMQAQFKKRKVTVVIDATHPFAEEVSKEAMVACQHCSLPYIRYERESLMYHKAHYYDSYQALIEYLLLVSGNILLTIGSNNLHRFVAIEPDRLVARVLPVTASLEKCAEAHIPLKNIIATKGTFTVDTNKAFLREYGIEHLVMKESGAEGGGKEKVEAALSCGVAIHILKRPQINYPNVVNNVAQLLNVLKGH